MLGGFDGGIEMTICGAPRRIVFNWAALAELKAKFGAEFQNTINTGLADQDPDIMAELLSVGTARAVAPLDIMRESPPIVSAVDAISKALRLAYLGSNGAPEARSGPLVRMARAIENALASIRFRMPLAFG